MRLLLLLSLAGILSLAHAAGGYAATRSRSAADRENAVVPTTAAGVLALIRISLPPAPEGWAVESETASGNSSSAPAAANPDDARLSYEITYRRAGIAEETRKLEDRYAALVSQITESASSRTAALLQIQSETDKAIKKARQRKEIGRERALRKEAAAIEAQLRTVAEETEQQLVRETEAHLVRDRELSITITLNEQAIEFPHGAASSRPKAAFVLRRESERTGMTGWREGCTLLLYGDWQEVQPDQFRARIDQPASAARPQTIIMKITGEKSRIDQFIKKTDMRSIIGMMP